MYENTIFEPIYGHSDWGSALVALIVLAISLGAAWAVGTVATKIGSKKS